MSSEKTYLSYLWNHFIRRFRPDISSKSKMIELETPTNLKANQGVTDQSINIICSYMGLTMQTYTKRTKWCKCICSIMIINIIPALLPYFNKLIIGMHLYFLTSITFSFIDFFFVLSSRLAFLMILWTTRVI